MCFLLYKRLLGGSFSPETCGFSNPPYVVWYLGRVICRCCRDSMRNSGAQIGSQTMRTFTYRLPRTLQTKIEFFPWLFSEIGDLWYINCFLERKALQLRSHVDFLLIHFLLFTHCVLPIWWIFHTKFSSESIFPMADQKEKQIQEAADDCFGWAGKSLELPSPKLTFFATWK